MTDLHHTATRLRAFLRTQPLHIEHSELELTDDQICHEVNCASRDLTDSEALLIFNVFSEQRLRATLLIELYGDTDPTAHDLLGDYSAYLLRIARRLRAEGAVLAS